MACPQASHRSLIVADSRKIVKRIIVFAFIEVVNHNLTVLVALGCLL